MHTPKPDCQHQLKPGERIESRKRLTFNGGDKWGPTVLGPKGRSWRVRSKERDILGADKSFDRVALLYISMKLASSY